MALEVGRQIKNESKPGESITRDFLGGFFGIESKELDLDLHVPTGWEKHLDLKSGKVYIQKCIQPSSPSEHNHKNPNNQTLPSSKKQQDVNHPPYLSTSNPKTTLNLFEEPSLNLNPIPNLPSSILGNCSNATYQSVCTLDKVKSALDRAWRVSSPTSSSSKKRPSPSNSASSMISIDNNNNDDLNLHSSTRENPGFGFGNGGGSGMLVAVACPGCLLYVLISESNPKCPKCNSIIPLSVMHKKPKIDLNI